MKKYATTIESALQEALEMLAQGKTKADVLVLFPEWESELSDLLETVEIIHMRKEEIRPSPEFVSHILQKAVTNETIERYAYEKGRDQTNSLEGQIHEYMKKLLTPAGVIAAIALIVVFVSLNQQEDRSLTSLPQVGEEEIVVPDTQDVDTLLAVLDQLAARELSIVETEGEQIDSLQITSGDLVGFDQILE